MNNIKERMATPDILKLAATASVIVIHHKMSKSAEFFRDKCILAAIFLSAAAVLGTFLYLRERKQNHPLGRKAFISLFPIACVLAVFCFGKTAMNIFMLMTGYMLAGSLLKLENPIKEWYEKKNFLPRILRFYLPLALPLFLAFIFKIFIRGNTFSPIEIIGAYAFGGFKPGGYYVIAMFQILLLVPLIFALVKKYGRWGVLIVAAVHLIYDIAAWHFGMSAELYKYVALRYLTHIALGVWARVGGLKANKKICISMAVFGFLYMLFYCYTRLLTSHLCGVWRFTSIFSVCFSYPVVVLFMKKCANLKYGSSRFSNGAREFANATYHIFLIQTLYYTTVGFALNAKIGTVYISIPLNLLVCLTLGFAYYKAFSPIENKVLGVLRKNLQ